MCCHPLFSKGCKVMQTRTYMQTCITMPSITPLRRIYVLGTKHKKRVDCNIKHKAKAQNSKLFNSYLPLFSFLFLSPLLFFIFIFPFDVCSSQGLLFIFCQFVISLKMKKTFSFLHLPPLSTWQHYFACIKQLLSLLE